MNLVHILEISRPSVQNIPPAALPTGSHCPPVRLHGELGAAGSLCQCPHWTGAVLHVARVSLSVVPSAQTMGVSEEPPKSTRCCPGPAWEAREGERPWVPSAPESPRSRSREGGVRSTHTSCPHVRTHLSGFLCSFCSLDVGCHAALSLALSPPLPSPSLPLNTGTTFCSFMNQFKI